MNSVSLGVITSSSLKHCQGGGWARDEMGGAAWLLPGHKRGIKRESAHLVFLAFYFLLYLLLLVCISMAAIISYTVPARNTRPLGTLFCPCDITVIFLDFFLFPLLALSAESLTVARQNVP